MNRKYFLAIITGKIVRRASLYLGKSGSALPGLVVEKLFPNYLSNTLKNLPVVMVVGTNGKTTTTKIIKELLESQGLRVFSNGSGSNFVRGIISALIQSTSLRNFRLDKDIAVLEVDEAYGPHLIKHVKPDYVVGLNVMRDQTDRYGELTVAKRLIESVVKSAQKGCVINADEPELAEVGSKLSVPVHYYGASTELKHLFPSDAQLLMRNPEVETQHNSPLEVQLISFKGQEVCYGIKGNRFSDTLKLKGQYSFHNAAAALALAQEILPSVSPKQWLESLKTVEPAFGRGETIIVDGKVVEIYLVKNPSSFRQTISFHGGTTNKAMIAINDKYADGRDVSWLWDVDFSSLKGQVEVVSGTRANDMALRLHYDNVDVKHIEHDPLKALKILMDSSPLKPVQVFCTYTNMLVLREKLAQLANLPSKI